MSDAAKTMTQDIEVMWADEVREYLAEWSAWTRGNQLVRGTRHVLAAMIQRAAGEVPGADSGTRYEFTIIIEATDKAIARMKLDSAQYGRSRKKYTKTAKNVLMSSYLGNRSTREIAEKMDVSENHVKALLWYAESYVGRLIPQIEEELNAKKPGRSIALV